jgi:hypothetical protein
MQNSNLLLITISLITISLILLVTILAVKFLGCGVYLILIAFCLASLLGYLWLED